MAEIVSDWLHYDSRQPKRKRAELVCSSCHSKKVKCDLQTQTQAREEQGHSGHGTCSNCFSAGRDCQVYISKRKRHHSTADATSSNGGNSMTAANEIGNGNGRPVQTADTAPAIFQDRPHQNFPRSPSEAADTIHATIGTTAAAPIHPPSSSQLQPERLQSQAPLDLSALPSLSPKQPELPQHRQYENRHGPPSHNGHDGTPQSQRTGELTNGAPTGRSNPIDVDTGFLHVYSLENQIDAERQELEASLEHNYSLSDAQHSGLQQIFAETYLEYCYTWCPVLDIDKILEDTLRSPLLANALALAGSHVRPPLIPHDGPKAYYKRATSIFYNDEESDGLTTLQAISLFYWWAPRSPALARRHSSWWWTSVLIRHAQQMNFHREPGPTHPLRDVLQLSLRRRIWWTAFARERLTALCQSKPCIIDPADCNIQEVTLADFPPDSRLQRKGEVFIYWVRLCGIIGKVAKTLSRSAPESPSHFGDDLRQELIGWVQSLPPHLQLPIGSARTETFDRDVHQLHLPYLTTIIILHLRRSAAQDLPHALSPAILAASCIVRILRDILSRGDTRFLLPITCWYAGTAYISLLQACRIEDISRDANEGLDVLTSAVEQLQRMWGSGDVVRQGFDRLRKSHATHVRSSGGNDRHSSGDLEAGNTFPRPTPSDGTLGGGIGGTGSRPPTAIAQLRDQGISDRIPSGDEDEIEWPLLFPFVTRQTSRTARVLLPGSQPGIPPTRFPSPDNQLFHQTFIQDYQGFFDPFDPYLGFGDVVNGIL